MQDEHAMKEEGRMSNPIFSSVYYVTGSSEEGRLRQVRPRAMLPVNDLRCAATFADGCLAHRLLACRYI